MFSFFLGNNFQPLDQIKIQMMLPILFFITLARIPDSPDYWIKRNKKQVLYHLKSFEYVMYVQTTTVFNFSEH